MAAPAEPPYFPAFLDVRGRRVVVAGGGEVAARKAEALVRSGADVEVVAPRACAALLRLAQGGALRYLPKRFDPDDLAGAAIAIAATGDATVNAAVAQAARDRGILVNVADDPASSTFLMASVVERLPVQIAISTAGSSPVLARRIAAMVEQAVPPAMGRLAALAARFRAQAKRRFADPAERRRFWERAMSGAIARKVLEGAETEAAALLERELGEAPASDGTQQK